MKNRLIKLRLHSLLAAYASGIAHRLADACNNDPRCIDAIYQHITNTSLMPKTGRPPSAAAGALNTIIAVGLHQIDLFISESPEAQLNLIGQRISDLVALSPNHYYRYVTFISPVTIHPQRAEWTLRLHSGLYSYLSTFNPETLPPMRHLHNYIDRLEIARGRQVTGRRNRDTQLIRFALEIGCAPLTDCLNEFRLLSTDDFIQSTTERVSTRLEVPLLDPHVINNRKTSLSREVNPQKVNSGYIDPRKPKHHGTK